MNPIVKSTLAALALVGAGFAMGRFVARQQPNRPWLPSIVSSSASGRMGAGIVPAGFTKPSLEEIATRLTEACRAGAWRPSNPTEAAGWIALVPSGPLKLQAVNLAVYHLGSRDRRAAFALIETLPAAQRQGAYITVFAARAAAGPVAAAAALDALGLPTLQRFSILDAIVGAWVDSDPPAALRWAATLADGREKNALRASLVEATLHFLRGVPGPERDHLIQTISGTLAADDPVLAAAFAQALPSGAPQIAALSNIAASLARQDPAEAIRWAQALPESAAKRSALEHVAQALAAASPERAAMFAAALPPAPPRSSRRKYHLAVGGGDAGDQHARSCREYLYTTGRCTVAGDRSLAGRLRGRCDAAKYSHRYGRAKLVRARSRPRGALARDRRVATRPASAAPRRSEQAGRRLMYLPRRLWPHRVPPTSTSLRRLRVT